MKALPANIPAIFTFSHHNPVRIVDIDGEPWFVATDVCDALSIQNPTQAASRLDEDERSMFNIGRQGNAIVINESGLYTLVLRCRDATKAGSIPHRFRKWVTSEVLPTIRKHGVYAVPTVRSRASAHAGAELLAATDMANLRRVIWRISCGVLYEDMWIKAAWQALRRALNVPAGQRFAVDHLPEIGRVLREVCLMADATRAACDKVSLKAIRMVQTGKPGRAIQIPSIELDSDPLNLMGWADREIARLTSRGEPIMDHPEAGEPA